MTARQLATARAAWGALLMLAPAAPLRTLTGGREPVGGSTLLRVLGARHALQAAATLAAPSPWTLRLGAVADGLHATSAVVFARIDARERRAALIDAALAAAWAALSLQAARR